MRGRQAFVAGVGVILAGFTEFRRNRMWQSREILSALDDFAARAGHRGGS
jgi:hypothetical protein